MKLLVCIYALLLLHDYLTGVWLSSPQGLKKHITIKYFGGATVSYSLLIKYFGSML